MKSTIIPTLAPEVKAAIDKANAILLHCHPNPDPDSVGSVLAMYHALRAMGKLVTVIAGDSPKPENMAALPGFEDIKQQTYGETDLSGFDLFIILDSGAPTLITRLVPVEFPPHLNTIVIDHHASNTGYAAINLIESSYPAAAQVLFDFFKTLNIPITKDIAICLFVGMYYDTGGFRFRGVTSDTFAAASELVEIYPDFPVIISSISDNLKPESLYFQAKAFEQIDVIGPVAIMSLSYELLKQYNFTEDSTKNQSFANILISVKGWNVGITIIEKEPGMNRISLRAKENAGVDVSKIAIALGGGGHKPAAGAVVQGTNGEAKQKVLEVIQATYPDLFV